MAIAPFRRLRLRVANAWLLDGGSGARWLIDTGHRAVRALLLAELRSAGVAPSELVGVLLTHRHSDHAGNAAFLQGFGVKVYAHRADADVLAGRAPAAPLVRGEGSFFAGLLARVENHFPSRVDVDAVLDEGSEVGGLQVHWVPGHTEGSVFYHHVPTGALVTGDMLLNAIPPLTLRAGLSLPYPSFTLDRGRALESLRRFHAGGARYQHMLPGHGPALIGAARERVGRLLAGAAAGV